tara:strand:+ start:1017 stop:1256 length:240 start_codon:yes stop_codon:yes gene_type:complete
MYLFELKERLDYLFKELYNSNASIDDVRDEIEDELKELMSPELYKSCIEELNKVEEKVFLEDWNMPNLNSLGDGKEMEW